MTDYKLQISLKRVQTFIFEVPRLKSMLGANALVGQTMRHELAKLMNGKGKPLKWPSGLVCDRSGDPLASVSREDQDDPAGLYRKGILVRDGGRFSAVFEDSVKAEEFKKEAETCLAENLPGVMYDIEISPLATEARNREFHIPGLPVLQICQDTGNEPASEPVELPDGQRWVSRSVKHRIDWSEKFYRGNTKDIIGLMRGELYPDSKKWKRPDDIGQLTAGGYLALIHADGNRIGLRYKEFRSKKEKGGKSADDMVAQEAYGESFFHSMRVAVRKSLVAALDKTFEQKGGTRPYEFLMLGGDDLLLACRADKALEFSINYAKELKKYELADGSPLDVAIGVAIAKKSYPLHRLHELAENLAASAKRLYRARYIKEGKSVIDWQVVTQSWFADVAEARRKGEMVQYSVVSKNETLLLTLRPYCVLGDEDSLEQLYEKSVALKNDDDKAGRSALRGLRKACEQGKLSGEMAYRQLPKELGESLWQKSGDIYTISALDIIGIAEIKRLRSAGHD